MNKNCHVPLTMYLGKVSMLEAGLAIIQISEAVVKMELKKKDIEKLLEKESQLWKEFKDSVADDKFAEYLTKVYKKKIRRSKKKAAKGPGMCHTESYFSGLVRI